MKKLLYIITSIIIGIFVFYTCDDSPTGSQKDKITGTIQDLDGTPVQGVAVSLKIKNISTTTDNTGSFEIDASGLFDRSIDDVIDTLMVSHNQYLSVWRYIRSLSAKVDIKIWDNKYHVTNQIPGWTDSPQYFTTFDSEQLWLLIDGGDEKYKQKGLIDGINQYLQKGVGISCDVMIYNFGTSEKSIAMFNENVGDITTKVHITGYDESLVVGEEIGGGATIYAHFGQFQLEFMFQGFSDIELVKTEAAHIIQVYESIIGFTK